MLIRSIAGLIGQTSHPVKTRATSSDFSYAVLAGAKFHECQMRKAVLVHANAEGATFYCCDLREVDFRKTDTSTVQFIDCQLAGVRGVDQSLGIDWIEPQAPTRWTSIPSRTSAAEGMDNEMRDELVTRLKAKLGRYPRVKDLLDTDEAFTDLLFVAVGEAVAAMLVSSALGLDNDGIVCE